MKCTIFDGGVLYLTLTQTFPMKPLSCSSIYINPPKYATSYILRQYPVNYALNEDMTLLSNARFLSMQFKSYKMTLDMHVM